MRGIKENFLIVAGLGPMLAGAGVYLSHARSVTQAESSGVAICEQQLEQQKPCSLEQMKTVFEVKAAQNNAMKGMQLAFIGANLCVCGLAFRIK